MMNMLRNILQKEPSDWVDTGEREVAEEDEGVKESDELPELVEEPPDQLELE